MSAILDRIRQEVGRLTVEVSDLRRERDRAVEVAEDARREARAALQALAESQQARGTLQKECTGWEEKACRDSGLLSELMQPARDVIPLLPVVGATRREKRSIQRLGEVVMKIREYWGIDEG